MVVTAGASAGFTLAFLACFDAGDRVGVVEPGYPCYRNTLLALGVEPRRHRRAGRDALGADDRRCSTAAGPLDGLVVASPVQPDRHGARPPSAWRRSSTGARAHEAQLISDEIYHGITYGQRAESALAPRPTPSWSSTASPSTSR